jgi:hypothetical protein
MYDLSRQLESALESSEHLLWSGAPVTGIRFTMFDWFMIPFSIAWGGFAIIWEVLAISAFIDSLEESFDLFVLIFPIFGIPFVIIGAYMMVGRFIADARERERTYYGITDRNVIIITGKEQNIRVLPLASLHDVMMKARRDGSGTIMLESPLAGLPQHDNARSSKTKKPEPPAITMIPNVKVAYDVLQRARASSQHNVVGSGS